MSGTKFGNEYEGEMRKGGEEKRKVWRLGDRETRRIDQEIMNSRRNRRSE